jgi:DNA mismatch endonuclease (patch repair protein)
LFRRGFRFRKNVKTLPGSPDIVLPKYKTAIFIHGCFWHNHHNCPKANLPNTNIESWKQKIAGNVKRDRQCENELTGLGWKIIVVWQCELKNQNVASSRLDMLISEIES